MSSTWQLVQLTVTVLVALCITACNEPPPTATAIPPTATLAPTATAVPPTATPAPTATAIPPTATLAPTATAVPPTATPAPTATAVPPTATLEPTATAIPPTGDWRTVTSNDPLADRQSISLGLVSTTYTPARGDDQAILFIRCSYGGQGAAEWTAFIAWQAYINNEEPVRVLYRFDAGAVESGQWSLSTDNTATFVPYTGGRPPNFLFVQRLQESTRFVARVARYNDQAITATWEVAGLTAALQVVYTQCHD